MSNSSDKREPINISGVSYLEDMKVFGGMRVLIYPHKLIYDAREQLKSQEFGLTIILCAVACEVAVAEYCMGCFKDKGLETWGEKTLPLLNGFALTSAQKRNFFKEVTGIDVEDITQSKTPYGKLFSKRNRVVHRGVEFSQQDAEMAIEAAAGFINHIKRRGVTLPATAPDEA